jgi:hypothetical protein
MEQGEVTAGIFGPGTPRADRGFKSEGSQEELLSGTQANLGRQLLSAFRVAPSEFLVVTLNYRGLARNILDNLWDIKVENGTTGYRVEQFLGELLDPKLLVPLTGQFPVLRAKLVFVQIDTLVRVVAHLHTSRAG